MAGCGGPTTAPAPATGGATAAKRPHLMLILPTTDGDDVTVFRDVLQNTENGAGREYIYREGIVRDGMPPSQQAEVIREAIEKGASALLVVAADAAAVAPALEEARGRGVPVVVIGREIPAEGDPFPVVAFGDAEESAGRIMAGLAKRGEAGDAPEAQAVILSDSAGGWRTQDLVGALKAAAAGSGVAVAEVVPFEKRVASAREALAGRLGDGSSVGILLFEDRVGAEAAAQAANDPARGGKGGLRLGGFVAGLDPALRQALGPEAVVMDRRVGEVAKQAARTALRLLKGEKVPDRVVIEPELAPGGLARERPESR